MTAGLVVANGLGAAMTDCRPVSLFSLQTGRRLGEELGIDLDKRRFTANVFIDLASIAGFAEDGFVGRKLRIGSKAVVSVLERDPRCAMITSILKRRRATPQFSAMSPRPTKVRLGSTARS